ncbi:MAG TPA: hypothetical protein VNM72_11080 [Blastocatellia bacterium]|nr:hypothetical protein [Blastocatellia bacterium]
MKTVPEPNAELLSAADVPGDVARLTAALKQARAEREGYHEFMIPKGTRFACLALEGASLANGLPEQLDLKDGLWALLRPPFEMAEHWQEWLGSIQARHFSNSNFLLFGTHPVDQMGVSDRELRDKVMSLFYAILMHGVPHYDAALLLTGENWSGTINVQSVTTPYRYYRAAKVLPARIDENTLMSAAIAAAGLRTIYASKQDYRRLKKGFEAWTRGMREGVGIYRLHQFVRAIEAVVKPSTRQTRRRFVQRCQLFAGRSDQIRNLLGELYDLRSYAEHMNDYQAVLGRYGPKWETIGSKRAYQAELLASHVYLRILKEDGLRSIFISDESIDQFWRKHDDERVRVWGEAIDLETEVRARFLDFD